MKNKTVCFACVTALVHTLFSLHFRPLIFNQIKEKYPVYAICSIIAFICLFSFYLLMYKAWFGRINKNYEYCILCNSCIYAIPIFLILFLLWPGVGLDGDMPGFFVKAMSLDLQSSLHYLTIVYYVVSLMIIPHICGPTIVLIVLWSILIGYIVTNFSKIFSKRTAKIIFIIFWSPTIIYLQFSPTRLTVYALLYLAFFAICWIEYKLKNKCTFIKLFCILVMAVILSCWRYEGIYMMFLFPVLIATVYPILNKRKKILTIFVVFLFIRFLINMPENLTTTLENENYAKIRMLPFLNYTLTAMIYNDKDFINNEKNKPYIDHIDKVLDIDIICEIIKDSGEDIYKDNLIFYRQDFSYNIKDYNDFYYSCIQLFIHNPDVFFKTRWAAFNYVASNKYHVPIYKDNILLVERFQNYENLFGKKIYFRDILFPQIRSSILKAISSVTLSPSGNSRVFNFIKFLFYNLYIPAVGFFLLFLRAIFKRNKLELLLFSGLLIHGAFIFILAPAGFFYYYFMHYIVAYFSIWIYLLEKITCILDHDI